MHKNTIHTGKVTFFIDNDDGARHARLHTTRREYKTYKNVHDLLYIKIKGTRYYFINAAGALLHDYDFDFSYCN